MYLLFIRRGVGHNDFDAGKSITRAIDRGAPLKSRLFWALKWQRVSAHFLNILVQCNRSLVFKYQREVEFFPENQLFKNEMIDYADNYHPH